MVALFGLVTLLVTGFCALPVQGLAAPPCTVTRLKITSLSMAAGNNRDKYNPFSTMFSDMASSVFGGNQSSATSNPQLEASLASFLSENELSWDTVHSKLASLQTPDERNFRSSLATGRGPASPLHKIRLYDDSNDENQVRVTFFRDSASWCPYCQKVWMMLEEKRIPYRVEKINMRCYGDKPATFTRIQPNGNIPVAIIDGTTYGQSNDIMYALEELFPTHTTLRPPPGQESRAQVLLRLERAIFSAWMYWLTGSRDTERYRQEFMTVLQQVETALAQTSKDGPFFLGNQVTLVDFMFAPFLERMCASLLFFKGFIIRVPPQTPTDYPALNQWFDGMETLESYRLTKSDYYTHCWDLPPQLGGCTYEPAGEVYEKAINGERSLDGTRGSWELPLQPHNGGVEPDWTWVGDDAAARREAVERVSANYNAIVSFAARGAGRKGMPPYSAVLADPKAIPNEAVQNGIQSILLVVCMALLEENNTGIPVVHDATMTQLANSIVQKGESAYTDGIIASLAYLRDRVGVPRDMRLPAARQLRAHLNWAIGKVLSASQES